MSEVMKRMQAHARRKNSAATASRYMSPESEQRMIIKGPNSYGFSYQTFVDRIPGGTYFPHVNKEMRQFQLVVAQVDLGRREAAQEEDDENYSPTIADAVEGRHPSALLKEVARGLSGDGGSGESNGQGNGQGDGGNGENSGQGNGHDNGSAQEAGREQQPWYHYMDQHYFPMEDYVAPFADLRDTITKFIGAKDFYRRMQIDYKRSVLVYGDPGTGKTRFIANICEEMIREHDAIVIRIERNEHMTDYITGVQALANFCRGRMKVVVIEEFSELLSNRTVNSDVLNMLDSTLLKDDIIYLITTNYPSRIPDNIIDRPSRLDDMVPVYREDFDREFILAWYGHLMGAPMPERDRASGLLDQIDGRFTPVYLKELFLRAYMHQQSLGDALRHLKKRREQIDRGFDRKDTPGFRDLGF